MHYKYTDIKAIVAEILENKKDEGGVKNIYFVLCTLQRPLWSVRA